MAKFEVNIEAGIGVSGAYFMYAAICAAGTLFVLFLVPETKGKNPEELKVYFRGEDKKPLLEETTRKKEDSTRKRDKS